MDYEHCVFEARYRKIGANQWKRVGKPEIAVRQESPWPSLYVSPQIEVLSDQMVLIRVRNDQSVYLASDLLLGDYDEAASATDQKLLSEFPGDVIVDSLSDWT